MYRDIKIGSKTVGMLANAASPYLFKQIFKRDFLKESQAKEFDPSLIEMMGFVMAKQAETEQFSDLLKLNESAYFEWLAQFEPLDVLSAGTEISSLYMGQTLSTSVPKNEAD